MQERNKENANKFPLFGLFIATLVFLFFFLDVLFGLDGMIILHFCASVLMCHFVGPLSAAGQPSCFHFQVTLTARRVALKVTERPEINK